MSRTRPLVAAVLVLALATASQAFPQEGQAASPDIDSSEALLLLQIVLLILTGRLLGEALQRVGQPAVMGQLLAGVLLGPTAFGLLWPSARNVVFPDVPAQRAMLDAVSHVGVLLLLLLAGMETDLSLVRKARRAAASASVAGIAAPFVAGVLLGQFLPAASSPIPSAPVASLFLCALHLFSKNCRDGSADGFDAGTSRSSWFHDRR
jgi:Kef-type K+ transport system membrane component KefB